MACQAEFIFVVQLFRQQKRKGGQQEKQFKSGVNIEFHVSNKIKSGLWMFISGIEQVKICATGCSYGFILFWLARLNFF